MYGNYFKKSSTNKILENLTSWLGPRITSKTIFLPLKLAYCGIYVLINIDRHRTNTFTMLKSFS